jgi:hypothetical protein
VSGVVKAEVQAVRELKTAVTRYSQQLREAAAAARREMSAAEANARDAVDQRRSQVNRATQELQQAQEALRRTPEVRRDEFRRAVVAAEHRARQAQQGLAQARKAGQVLSTASSELLKTLQMAEASVAEQSSAAARILASLDGKLAEITGGGVGSFVRNTVTSIGVAAEIAIATVDVSKLAGNVSQGHLPTADHVTSISEMSDLQAEEQQQLWRDAESHRQHGSPSGGETIA